MYEYELIAMIYKMAVIDFKLDGVAFGEFR